MLDKDQITTRTDGLLVPAPAKINLSLLIAGRRPDGFHEIETIMAKVNFFDKILIQSSAKSGIELICKGNYWAPKGPENLVYQACTSLLKKCSLKSNIKITLTKNIPAGSGLGSASSDAAATLIGVNRYLALGIPPAELAEIACNLGSDVSFFLNGSLAFCNGKGEKIEEIEEKFHFLAVLALPDINVSTKRVYENYKHDAAVYKQLKNQISCHLKKNRIDLASRMCANMLQESCFALYEELAELKAEIESSGIRPLCLSGSGAGMFCIIDGADEKKASRYQHILENKIGCKSIIVSDVYTANG